MLLCLMFDRWLTTCRDFWRRIVTHWVRTCSTSWNSLRVLLCRSYSQPCFATLDLLLQTGDTQHTHTHPFNGPLSRTTRVSRYQKGKTNLDFTEASVAVASAGPYASLHLALQITMPAPHHSVFTDRMPFLLPKQQCQSTEGNTGDTKLLYKCQKLSKVWRQCRQHCWSLASSPLSKCAGCRQQGHACCKTLHWQNPPVLNGRRWLTQVDVYNGHKTGLFLSFISLQRGVRTQIIRTKRQK